MEMDDKGTRLDEIELTSLQKIVSQVEAAIAASTPASRSVFENLLRNTLARIETLDKKLKEAQKEREERGRSDVVLAKLALEEKALTSAEQATYSGFLERQFFTKRDFGELQGFYAKTWDRLSENGKDEMSYRVWEGVRRDEYQFSELPAVVQEKESLRVYQSLTGKAANGSSISSIPSEDREAFMAAYESHDKSEAAQVLNRASFAKNIATTSVSSSGDGTRSERENVASRISAGVAGNSASVLAPEALFVPESLNAAAVGSPDLQPGSDKISSGLPPSPSSSRRSR